MLTRYLAAQLALILLVLGSVWLATPSVATAGTKVEICHIPPDNPDNFHTLRISENAVPSHLENHGDLLGSCSENCEALCDDGNFCTQDVPSGGNGGCYCNSGERPPVDCDDGNDCTENGCNPSTGCISDTSARDGNVCDDLDAGTINDQCTDGVCEGEVPALQIRVDFSALLDCLPRVGIPCGKTGMAEGTFGVFTVSSFPETIPIDVTDIVLVGDLLQPSSDGTFTVWSAATGLSIRFDSPTEAYLVGTTSTETPPHHCGGQVSCKWIINPESASAFPNTAQYTDPAFVDDSGIGSLALTTTILP
jgi:hypothetical protein